jgi:predicted RNase H-like nuclease (RuvC/YqgF family)
LGRPRAPRKPAATNPEIERLKAQLAAQQEQIDQLRRALEDEKKVLDQASQPKPPSLGQVASTTPIVPAGDAEPVLHPGVAAAVAPPAVGYRARIAFTNTHRNGHHYAAGFYGFHQRLPFGGRG